MSNTVTCRVDVSDSSVRVSCDPEPSSTTPAATSGGAAKPRPAPPTLEGADGSPAARAALVQRFSSELTPRLPQPPRPGDIALTCLGEMGGLALGTVGATALHPMLGTLAAFKAGYDVGKCVALERNAALQAESDARGIAQCEADGGVPVSISAGVVTCLVPPGGQP